MARKPKPVTLAQMQHIAERLDSLSRRPIDFGKCFSTKGTESHDRIIELRDCLNGVIERIEEKESVQIKDYVERLSAPILDATGGDLTKLRALVASLQKEPDAADSFHDNGETRPVPPENRSAKPPQSDAAESARPSHYAPF